MLVGPLLQARVPVPHWLLVLELLVQGEAPVRGVHQAQVGALAHQNLVDPSVDGVNLVPAQGQALPQRAAVQGLFSEAAVVVPWVVRPVRGPRVLDLHRHHHSHQHLRHPSAPPTK